MNNSTLHFLLIAIAVLVSSALALFVFFSPKPSSNEAAQEVSFLYVQHALAGSFQPAGSDLNTEYTLSLEEVWPKITYFSDRPDKISGTMTIEEFLVLDGLFSNNNPPNAAVVFEDPLNDDEDVIIVELWQPIYDKESSTISYRVAPLGYDVPDGLAHWTAIADPHLPPEFGSVALFIDSGSGPSENFSVQCPPGNTIPSRSAFDLDGTHVGERFRFQCLLQNLGGPDVMVALRSITPPENVEIDLISPEVFEVKSNTTENFLVGFAPQDTGPFSLTVTLYLTKRDGTTETYDVTFKGTAIE